MFEKKRTLRAAALALRGNEVCYGELVTEHKHFALENVQKFPVPSDCLSKGRLAGGARLGAFLRSQLSLPRKKVPLIVGIPTAECLCRLVTLPAADLSEARQALAWQFERSFPFAIADAFYDVSEVSLPVSSTKGTTVLVAAAQKKELLSLCDALSDHAVCVTAAEPQATACLRVLEPCCENVSGELYLWVIVFCGTVQFVAVCNGSVLFFRSLPAEQDEFASSAGLSQIAAEYEKTLAYVQKTCGALPLVRLYVPSSESAALAELPAFAGTEKVVFKQSEKLVLPDEPEKCLDLAGLLLRYTDEN